MRGGIEMKILIDFWVDGYDTEEEMEKACLGYLDDTLNGTATSLKILDLNNEKLEWFKKGMAVLTDDGNPDRETSLSNLCKMADSGLIGPLKKEEQE